MAKDVNSEAVESLTPREREVLDLLRLGLSDADIGERLGISRPGASYNVSEIIGKLGVRNRHEAAAWPDRPPWWATALAPIAALWRRAAGRVPGGAGGIALAVSIGLFALVLAGAGLIAFLLVRSDGGSEPALTEIVIPGSAMEAPEGYAFSTQIEVSSSEGDLNLTYDGVSEGLASKGTITGSGDLLPQLGIPADAEAIFAEQRIWLREPGGAWHERDLQLQMPDRGGIRQEQDWAPIEPLPLLNLGFLGAPSFYLDVYRFEQLRLPATGDVEKMDDSSANRVRLEKADVIALLEQLTSGNVGDETYHFTEEDIADVQDSARDGLPDDFVVETWVDEDRGYPVRLIIAFTVSDSTDGFGGVFPPLSSVRLQMDISRPWKDVVIEPPMPIPTEAPEEEARIMQIVADDPRVAEIAGGRSHSTSGRDLMWRTSEGEVVGVTAYLNFDEPFTYEGDWPSVTAVVSEGTDLPFREIVAHYRAEGIERLAVLVYLPEERVVEIAPEGAVISNRTPGPPD